MITVKKALESHNVDGEIYMCDVYRLFGWKIGTKKAKELHKQLTEMRNVKNL